MIVNEGEAVERIVDKFLEVKGSSDIGRGQQIYPEIPGQLDPKKTFYIDFLKCLDTWGQLVPTAIYLNQDEDSKVVRLLKRLREDRHFIFPENDMYQKYAREFKENMKAR